MKNHLLFDVFQMDVIPDGYGGWEESDRHYVATIKYPADSVKEIDRKTMLEIMADTYVRHFTGRQVPLTNSTDLRKMFVDDMSYNGTWFEVGVRYHHKPMYGLKLITERSESNGVR